MTCSPAGRNLAAPAPDCGMDGMVTAVMRMPAAVIAVPVMMVVVIVGRGIVTVIAAIPVRAIIPGVVKPGIVVPGIIVPGIIIIGIGAAVPIIGPVIIPGVVIIVVPVIPGGIETVIVPGIGRSIYYRNILRIEYNGTGRRCNGGILAVEHVCAGGLAGFQQIVYVLLRHNVLGRGYGPGIDAVVVGLGLQSAYGPAGKGGKCSNGVCQ